MCQLKIYEELKKRGVTLDSDKTVKRFNPNFFPIYIREKHKVIYKYKTFYLYDDNVWQIQDEEKFLKYLRDVFQAPMFGIWLPSIEKDYMVGMQREFHFEGELNCNRNLINLVNGMFDTENFTLIPHDSNYYSTIRIPIEFNPNAECHMWRKFLVEIFEGDEERIKVAQEWAGYMVSFDTNAQKALILNGEGENGKGVFIDTMRLVIGEDNISNIPLNELSNEFCRIKLHNKTANISGENEMNGKSVNTQYFKAIVGEDTISASEKYTPGISFKPTAKLILTMNNLPDTKDTSHGFFRRLFILSFNANFSGDKRDNSLREKLKEELPGIFIWAMEGLKRLRDNNYNFSQCKSMDDMLKRYQSEQKPMYEFFEDCIVTVEDESYREDNKLVYNTFKNWAIQNGVDYKTARMSSQRFWKEFEMVARKNGYKCTSGRSNTFRYHTGIKVVGEYKDTIRTNANNNFTVSIDD